jgi:transglutaminase-like putative cysteine protease
MTGSDSPRRASGLLRADLEPRHWLGTTPTLDLTDDRLRFRVKALTQLAKGERERALSIYGFVKAMPYCAPGKTRFPTARQLLDAAEGDCYGKSTLFVAMLRLARIPARLRFVQLKGELLRGYVDDLDQVTHAIVEAWLDGRWVKTDTHVYDIRYLVAARDRLNKANWDLGYSIHRKAQSIWDARNDAFTALTPDEDSGMPLADLGVFNDPQEFATYSRQRNGPQTLLKKMRWNAFTSRMARGIHELRAEENAAYEAVA